MPIDVQIEAAPRIVIATPRGTMTHRDMMEYQKSVWTRPEVAGFHEIVDMTKVEKVDFVSPEWVREITSLAAGMDAPGQRTRMAIVAVNEFHVGLAQMYGTLRSADPRSMREVRTFPSMAEALAWVTSPPTSPPAAAS